MFDLTNLRPATQIDVVKIVNDPHAEVAWRFEEPRLRALAITLSSRRGLTSVPQSSSF